ncbi:MAG: hypothetical protein IKI84_03320 [Clostridia bacterium]|nr:hypothetical protein [Clostridia bacterium]
MLKRLAALVLTVLIMVSFSLTAALSEGDRFALARERLLDDLLEYVSVSEKMWGGVFWLMDSFDRFDSEKSWESLQTARAALVITQRGLRDCVLPEAKMTQDDQFVFMDRGLDFSFMDYNSEMVDGDRINDLNLCENLHYSIMLGALTKDDWEICMKKIAYERKLAEYMIGYLAMTVDWVAASLDDPEACAEFDRELMEKCPMTSAYRTKEKKSPEEIEIDVDALLTEMEGFLADEAAVEGAMQHRLNVMTDLVETADLAAIEESIQPIAGMPPILPYPGWYDDRDIRYTWMENGTEANEPEMGSDSLRMPDRMRMSMTGVGDLEYREFIKELEGIGITCTVSSGGSLMPSYDCEYDGSTFSIVRDGKSVTFVMDTDKLSFVPVWYWYAVNGVGK